jgi:hypothetical protein
MDRRNTNRLEVCEPAEEVYLTDINKTFVYLIYPFDNVVGSSE